MKEITKSPICLQCLKSVEVSSGCIINGVSYHTLVCHGCNTIFADIIREDEFLCKLCFSPLLVSNIMIRNKIKMVKICSNLRCTESARDKL